MTNSLGGTYKTGTVTLTQGSTAIVGAGSEWLLVAEQGDWLYCNGLIVLIDSVTDNEHMVATDPWPGANQTDADYTLVKMSWLRYEPAITQTKVRELLTYFAGVGVIYYITGDAPDDALGVDGQFTFNLEANPWKVWRKTGGVWVAQAPPAGIRWQSVWNVATTYAANDIVHRLGKAYISLQNDNVGHDPAAETDPGNPVWWDLVVVGGARVELMFGDNDQPTSGEELFEALFTTDTVFPIGLAESQGKAKVAATADCVLSVRKNDVEFGTITFAAGETSATFASENGATFAAEDVLTVVVPDPRDMTLAGIKVTLVGNR